MEVFFIVDHVYITESYDFVQAAEPIFKNLVLIHIIVERLQGFRFEETNKSLKYLSLSKLSISTRMEQSMMAGFGSAREHNNKYNTIKTIKQNETATWKKENYMAEQRWMND